MIAWLVRLLREPEVREDDTALREAQTDHVLADAVIARSRAMRVIEAQAELVVARRVDHE